MEVKKAKDLIDFSKSDDGLKKQESQRERDAREIEERLNRPMFGRVGRSGLSGKGMNVSAKKGIRGFFK